MHFYWNLFFLCFVRFVITQYMYLCRNGIDGVMVRVIASNVIDRVLEPLSSQPKDYKIDICCFSAKNAA